VKLNFAEARRKKLSKHSQLVDNKLTFRLMAIIGIIAMSAAGLASLSTQSARADIETRLITETGIKFCRN
jgi:hypothetical protein